MDNLDFREEKLYGATTHVTSQIVVQQSHVKQRQLQLASSNDGRERMLHRHVQEDESSSQKYQVPTTLFTSSLTDHVRNEWYQPNATKIQCAVEKDLVWSICRFLSSSVEINDSVKYNISNWKSYNCRMFEENVDESDTVGYLPLYDGSSQMPSLSGN